jgi:enoyl-CoA hydratase
MTSLLIREEGPTVWLTLNRPERLNALDGELSGRLRVFFSDLFYRQQTRIVVLAATGRGFCSGLDLKETAADASQSSVSDLLLAQHHVSEIITAMRRCPQPIIALLNGAASGGGFALALAADIRIATPKARMNAAFIKVGASGCDVGVSYFLPRMIGSSAAAEFLLTGRFIEAERARELGLVSRIVEEERLEAEAQSFIDDMLRTTPLGLRLTKEALNHAIDAQSLAAVLAMEDRNQVLCRQGEDFSEGVAAFLEKREPHYSA